MPKYIRLCMSRWPTAATQKRPPITLAYSDFIPRSGQAEQIFVARAHKHEDKNDLIPQPDLEDKELAQQEYLWKRLVKSWSGKSKRPRGKAARSRKGRNNE